MGDAAALRLRKKAQRDASRGEPIQLDPTRPDPTRFVDDPLSPLPSPFPPLPSPHASAEEGGFFGGGLPLTSVARRKAATMNPMRHHPAATVAGSFFRDWQWGRRRAGRCAAWLGAWGATTLTLWGWGWGPWGVAVDAQPPGLASGSGRGIDQEVAQARSRIQAELADLTARFNPPARALVPTDPPPTTGSPLAGVPGSVPLAAPTAAAHPLASLIYHEAQLTVFLTRYDDHVAVRGWQGSRPGWEKPADQFDQPRHPHSLRRGMQRLPIREFSLRLDHGLDPITRAALLQRQGLPPLIVGMVDSLISPLGPNREDDLDAHHDPDLEFEFEDEFDSDWDFDQGWDEEPSDAEADDAEFPPVASPDDLAAAKASALAERLGVPVTARSRAEASSQVTTTAQAAAATTTAANLPGVEGMAVASVNGQIQLEACYRDAQGQLRRVRAEGSAQAIEQVLIRDGVPRDVRLAILRALAAANR